MIRRPVLFVLLSLLLLSGCTLLQPQGSELSAKVDALVADKRYGDALDMLTRVSPDSPDYARFAERRKSVEALAAQYERKTLEEARQLIAQDRWFQALNLYDSAMKRLPRSTVLRDGLADLHKQQQARIAIQEQERVIARGEWLATEIAIYQRMSTIDPRNPSYDDQINKHQSDGEQTAALLFKIGTQAKAAGNDNIASRAIPLAARLSDKKEIQQASQKYEQQRDRGTKDALNLPDKRWRDLAQREQERTEAIKQLSDDYASAMKQKDYAAARTALGRLRTFAPEVVNEKGYEKDLSEKIDMESNRLYNEGVMFYGRSQFEKARDSWKKTLELTPTHTKAKESLDRVEKVLERINQLRSKQKSN